MADMTKSPTTPRKRESSPPAAGTMARSSVCSAGRGPHRRAAGRMVPTRRTAPGVEPGAVTSGGKYVYCIIESRDPLCFGPIGMGAAPADVYTVHDEKLAAVVSDAPPQVLTRENVLAHERVNQNVMR